MRRYRAFLEITPEGDGIPEWIQRWGADVALPATRAEAPSIWH